MARQPTGRGRAANRRAGRQARETGAESQAAAGSIAESGDSMRDDEVERSLLSGDNRDLLEANFGDAVYEELRSLVTRSRRRRFRAGPRVLVLPGIMGSTVRLIGASSGSEVLESLTSLVQRFFRGQKDSMFGNVVRSKLDKQLAGRGRSGPADVEQFGDHGACSAEASS